MVSKTSRKICGTCEYWTGNRKPIFDCKDNPKVDIIDNRGNCENANYQRFYEQSRCKENTCCHYSKWTELF